MSASTKKASLVASDLVVCFKGCIISGNGDLNRMDKEFGRAEGVVAALRFLNSRATSQEEHDIYDKAIAECQAFQPMPQEDAEAAPSWL